MITANKNDIIQGEREAHLATPLSQEEMQPVTAESAELESHWNRLKEHHEQAGVAFKCTVLAGIEIMMLKLKVSHGSFAKLAREHVPGLAERTVRRYREIGEWYVSASHGRPVTVRMLRADNAQPQICLCSDHAVAEYLLNNHIRTPDDLLSHVREKVEDFQKAQRRKKGARVDNVLKKVRRAVGRMSSDQKNEFFSAMDALRILSTAQAQPETSSDQTLGIPA